jgi:hypothetical protein
MFILFSAAWFSLLVLSLTHWRGAGGSRRVGLLFLLGLPIIFLAHWYMARIVVPLFVWLFVLGDNGGGFFDASTYLMVIPAAAITAFIAARVMFWRASPQYAVLNCAGSVAILLLVGGFHAYHFLSQIQGSTREAAARSIASRNPALNVEELRLVQVQTETHFHSDKCITYRGIDESGPRCHITVCRHGWWRKMGAYIGFSPRDHELARAKEWLLTNHRDARLILEEIVENYFDTPEGIEAKRLLQKEYGIR